MHRPVRILRLGLVGAFSLAMGCAGWAEPTADEDCRYVRRVGSRIPRLECNGHTQGMYGEMNQENLQNATNRMARPGR